MFGDLAFRARHESVAPSLDAHFAIRWRGAADHCPLACAGRFFALNL